MVNSMAELKIKKDNWYINNELVKISDLDMDAINTCLTDYISNLKKERAPVEIFKIVLKKYFKVSNVLINFNNKLFLELIESIRQNEAQKKFALACLDAETEDIIVKTKYIVFNEKNVNLVNLKKQIIAYINQNPNEIKISNIIFNSLEELSGYRANRQVTKYHKEGIRDVCVENPVYTKLCEFVNDIPEYQVNLAIYKRKSAEKSKKEKIGRRIQKEKEYLDEKFAFIETFSSPHWAYNCR